MSDGKMGHYSNNGDFVLHNYYQADSLSTAQVAYVEPPEWEKHYWQHSWDIPKPVMWKNQPMWRGDLLPPGIGERTPMREYICDFNMKYYLVNPDLELRQPTNAEYNKFFKRHVEQGTYRLKQTKFHNRVVRHANRKDT